MWPWRSTFAGMAVLPVRLTRFAPGGTFKSARRPAWVNCVLSTMKAEFSITLPSPVISLAPWKTVTCASRHRHAAKTRHHFISAPRGGFGAELIEETFDDHFRRCIDEPLADGGDSAAHFHGSIIGDIGSAVHGGKSEEAITLHEADFSGPVYAQAKTGGRVLIGDAHLAVKQAGDAGERHFHFHVVLAIADPLQRVASGHAFAENHRVLQQGVGAVRRDRYHVRARNFHEALESAMDRARLAHTRARWRR